MKNNRFKDTVYVVIENAIETMTYEEYLNEYFADETTSPRGVESKLHIREVEEGVENEDGEVTGTITKYQVREWAAGGKPILKATFDNEEEAELDILGTREYHHENDSVNVPSCFFDENEAKEWIKAGVESEDGGYEVE